MKTYRALDQYDIYLWKKDPAHKPIYTNKACALTAMLESDIEKYSEQIKILQEELDAIGLPDDFSPEETGTYVRPMLHDAEWNFYTEYSASKTSVKTYAIGSTIISFDGKSFNSLSDMAQYCLDKGYSKARSVDATLKFIERSKGKNKVYQKPFTYRE